MDSLFEKCIGVFFMMHAAQMLLEVVQARPVFVGTGATLPKAEIFHLRASLGLLVVNAFLMAGEVVDSAKALFTRTVGLVTFK